MRPQSIVNFERVVLLMLVLGLVSAVLSWDDMAIYLRRQGLGETFLYVAQAISIGITLLLLWLIAHRRSVVAKWIWIVLFVLSAAASVYNLSATLTLSRPMLVLQIVQWLLQIVSVWLLFRPDALAWFRGDSARTH
jgi:hypothetical protein